MLRRFRKTKKILIFYAFTEMSVNDGKSLWKGQLWDGSYFCETIGSTSEEKYIERQKTVSYEQSDQIQVIPYN